MKHFIYKVMPSFTRPKNANLWFLCCSPLAEQQRPTLPECHIVTLTWSCHPLSFICFDTIQFIEKKFLCNHSALPRRPSYLLQIALQITLCRLGIIFSVVAEWKKLSGGEVTERSPPYARKTMHSKDMMQCTWKTKVLGNRMWKKQRKIGRDAEASKMKMIGRAVDTERKRPIWEQASR